MPAVVDHDSGLEHAGLGVAKGTALISYSFQIVVPKSENGQRCEVLDLSIELLQASGRGTCGLNTKSSSWTASSLNEAPTCSLACFASILQLGSACLAWREDQDNTTMDGPALVQEQVARNRGHLHLHLAKRKLKSRASDAADDDSRDRASGGVLSTVDSHGISTQVLICRSTPNLLLSNHENHLVD